MNSTDFFFTELILVTLLSIPLPFLNFEMYKTLVYEQKTVTTNLPINEYLPAETGNHAGDQG